MPKGKIMSFFDEAKANQVKQKHLKCIFYISSVKVHVELFSCLHFKEQINTKAACFVSAHCFV